ncbi:extensin family protein [Porphyrobacter sp. ULC335]|uniref:extensin-like domain-containing protein n=1 Tax=Porphyrobacter sp. ULC335 TaxID=2854260 RepID=UPI00221ED2A1|nr:extensin family protein [Porphyrobacter sp. ULC335]UYV14669.1 extensin family protein [Porphyrobacter sp. ULC335]
MPRTRSNKHFRAARLAIIALVLLTGAIAGWQWLLVHPQHNPWAPLDLRDPPGWATRTKLARLKGDVDECRAVLARSDVAFTALPATGVGDCARTDRTRLGEYPLAPDTPAVTCPVAAALEIWRRDSVAPAARDILGSELARIEHLGAFSCRRMYGGAEGPWSEHATANAIDIAAFVLEDGQRISVLKDWDGTEAEKRFLRTVRDGACGSFATVLSPEYNAAHADHFHLDQDDRWAGVCR